MSSDIDLNFAHLSDREIAERLFKHFAAQLSHYAIKSWSLSEDDIWDILYDTLYNFINSYAGNTFSSVKQIESLIWTIFKNKLRDKFRQKKRLEDHYKEVSYSEEALANNFTPEPKYTESLWLKYNESALVDEAENSILPQLENILDGLEEWERQLVICHANKLPYTQIMEMTGKNADFLKVHYQRLKQRISKKLEESIQEKGKTHG